jgi:N-methylhydantoinase A
VQPSPTSAHSTRIGVDIGGTFTDVVLINSSGGMLSRKILSSIEDYGRAIRDVIGEVVVDAHLDTDTIHDVVHGTTICTNAILESKGARTGLLTTRGFRDTLELGRMRYPKLYDLTWRKPPPLVPRRLRFEVAERVGADGQVVEPLNANSARTVVKRLLAAGVESVAISLINSYANSQHELELRRLVAQVAPEIPVSVSSEVLPEIGEYERTSTTVINAYLQPVVGRYLAQLGESLASIQVRSPIWRDELDNLLIQVGSP